MGRKIMTKKLDSNLNLDFGDISTPKKKKSKQKKNESKDSVLNIPLSIPLIGSSGSFISKTISQCSAKEFSSWSQQIAYPLKSEIAFYNNAQNRLDHFMKALSYHRRNFIVANPNTYKTIH